MNVKPIVSTVCALGIGFALFALPGLFTTWAQEIGHLGGEDRLPLVQIKRVRKYIARNTARKNDNMIADASGAGSIAVRPPSRPAPTPRASVNAVVVNNTPKPRINLPPVNLPIDPVKPATPANNTADVAIRTMVRSSGTHDRIRNPDALNAVLATNYYNDRS